MLSRVTELLTTNIVPLHNGKHNYSTTNITTIVTWLIETQPRSQQDITALNIAS